jgi:hypothetical protein
METHGYGDSAKTYVVGKTKLLDYIVLIQIFTGSLAKVSMEAHGYVDFAKTYIDSAQMQPQLENTEPPCYMPVERVGQKFSVILQTLLHGSL